MQETQVWSLGQEDPLEKEMATHSSVLAWRIPGTGEPGGLPSIGSHRVGHDWSDLAAAAVLLKTVNLIQNKEPMRNFISQEEPKEPWPLSGMWCPEWDPGKAAGKTEDIQIKYGLKEAKNIVSESVH